MATTVDTTAKTLTVQTDHLTVFDYNINNWQYRNLPSVDSFQVSNFTGAGTYSMGLWIPPGTAGFQPNLTLSYNSQIVDEARAFTQTSWVGMGWSLDTPAITTNFHETENDTADDTYSLSLNGVSGLLLPVSLSGNLITYNTQNQNFVKVVRNTNLQNWTVYGKDGSIYYFGADNQAKTSTQGCANIASELGLTWRWSITWAKDKFGNQIDYSYYSPDSKGSCLNQLAVYPQYITYANGHYRVYFEREALTHYKDSWGDNESKVLFGKNRLKRVWIQSQAENFSQWSDSTNSLRQYEFTYGDNTSNVIFPNLNWGEGHSVKGALTLVSVQEKEGISTNPAVLKPTSFFYGDMMHLTRVDNGQGGSVEMAYQRWTYFNDNYSSQFTMHGDGACTGNPAAGWTEILWSVVCAQGSVQFEDRVVDGDGGTGRYPLTEAMQKLGGRYRFALYVRAIGRTYTGVNWGIADDSGHTSLPGHTNHRPSTTLPLDPDETYTPLDVSVDVPADFDASTLKMQIQCDSCRMYAAETKGWTLQLFNSYYQVVSRTVTDAVTGRATTLNYSYDNTAPNAWENSETIQNNGKSYFGLWREYRGNAFMRTVDSGNIANYTWYYQNDYLKGSPYHTIAVKESVYDDFETLPRDVNGNIASLPGWQSTNLNAAHVYAGGLYKKEFDTAAYTTYADGDTTWSTPLLRTNNTEIVDGRTVISHIKLSQYKPYLVNSDYAAITTVDANRKGEFGLISNTNQFFGIVVSWEGSAYVARLCETTTDICNTNGPILDNNFKLERYYVLMIVVDSTNGSQVRLWCDNTAGGNTVIKAGMSGTNWQYRQRAHDATLWLDTYSVSTLRAETENIYQTILQYGNQGTLGPLSNATLNGYYDLKVYWNQPIAAIARQYGTGRLWQGTKTDYGYDASDQNNKQYGNQTRVTLSSGGVSSASSNPNAWTPLRATHTYFYPQDSSAYLVSLPARTVTLDCSGGCDFNNNGNLKAETLYIYDTNSNYSSAPTTGKLVVQRVRAKDPSDTGNIKYAQADYGYDIHGNVNSISAYQGYTTVAANPTGTKYTNTKTYDTWYFAYPLTTTNPKSQTTTTTYNYKLGVPERVTDPNGITTAASYDVFGRMKSVCAPGDWDGTTCPATGSTLSIVYNDYTGTASPFNIVLAQKIDDSKSKQEVRYFDGTGKLLQVQQPGAQINTGTANIVVDTVYDSFGRAVKQSKPFTYTGSVAYQVQAPLDTYNRAATTTVYDDWSRVVTVSEPNGTSTGYTYGFVNDSDADVGWSFQTAQTNAKQQTTLQLQDAFGRVRKVIPPTENSSAIALPLKYTYDVLDRLSNIYQGSANTQFVYDEAGRKTSMTDPDMGTWYYNYDPQNNLITQTDARLCVTTLAYDELNRLTGKTFSGGTNCPTTAAIHYYYDDYTSANLAYTPGLSYAVGQRTGMTDDSGKTVWEYDLRGRETLESKSVLDGSTDLGTYVTRWTYNSADFVTTMTYPNLEMVSYTYLAQGVLNGVSSQSVNFVPSTVYDLNGRVTTLNLGLGNGTYQIGYAYNAWTQSVQGGHLSGIQVGTQANPTSHQQLEFNYDEIGNLNWIKDYKSGPGRNLTQTQTFHYDALNRLKDAVAQGAGGTAYGDYSIENYTYNNPQMGDLNSGNLTQNAGKNLSYATQSATCPGGDLSKNHAVTSMTTTGLNATYCYDLNGNMNRRTVNGVTANFSYDAANNLVSTSGSAVESYIFDGDGSRVVLKSGATTTVYIGQYFEITIDPNIPLPTSGSGGGTGCQASRCYYLPLVLKDPINIPPAHREWRSYIYAGSNRVAMRVQGGTRALLGDVFYMLGDFLGSTSLTIKADTLELTELRYKPWGETRYESGTTQTSFRYTGQRSDNATGLYWYNSRWYDPALGRFIQPDTIVPDPKDIQSFDRFAYVNNNPVNANDPTGHYACGDGINDPRCEQDSPSYSMPFTPTWILDQFGGLFGNDVAAYNIAEDWLNNNPNYDLFDDTSIWTTQDGYIVPRDEYAQFVQLYGAWRVIRGEQNILSTQMYNQAYRFIDKGYATTSEIEANKGKVGDGLACYPKGGKGGKGGGISDIFPDDPELARILGIDVKDIHPVKKNILKDSGVSPLKKIVGDNPDIGYYKVDGQKFISLKSRIKNGLIRRSQVLLKKYIRGEDEMP